MEPKHVEGIHNEHKVFLYALSTCGWCRKTKALLQELGIAYDYIDVDEQQGPDRELAKQEVLKWNPSLSFPTMVLDDKESVIGFSEARIRRIVSE
ncbi:glutaredoxin family protein [bacterium]|nr:glutaredoxin family protein [bacterium]